MLNRKYVEFVAPMDCPVFPNKHTVNDPAIVPFDGKPTISSIQVICNSFRLIDCISTPNVHRSGFVSESVDEHFDRAGSVLSGEVAERFAFQMSVRRAS